MRTKSDARVKTEPARRSTIYDVARMAGVSAGTVSHVINRTASISEETRGRVMKAIEALDYRRNANARALRTADSKIVGIVLQDITSEYYAQCIAGILNSAQRAGYTVVTANTQFNAKVLETSVAALLERRVSGMIFVGGTNDASAYGEADNAGIPVVFGDRYVENFPCVEFNNYDTMYHLVHALYAQGFRRFSYFGEGLETQQNLDQRLGGFCDGMRDLEIPESDWHTILEINRDSIKMKRAYELFPKHIEQGQQLGSGREIIMTSNDMIAQAVISVLLRAGRRVPEDVAVFGVDNISIAIYSKPSISTVVQDPYELGTSCFDLLLRRIRNPESMPQNIMLRQKIALRDSAQLDADIAQRFGLEIYSDEGE